MDISIDIIREVVSITALQIVNLAVEDYESSHHTCTYFKTYIYIHMYIYLFSSYTIYIYTIYDTCSYNSTIFYPIGYPSSLVPLLPTFRPWPFPDEGPPGPSNFESGWWLASQIPEKACSSLGIIIQIPSNSMVQFTCF